MLRGRVILGCNSIDTEELQSLQEKPHLMWTLQLPGKYLNLREEKIVIFLSIILCIFCKYLLLFILC